METPLLNLRTLPSPKNPKNCILKSAKDNLALPEPGQAIPWGPGLRATKSGSNKQRMQFSIS